MSTDYIEYAVVWSCRPLPNDRSNETFWVLSRMPEASANTTARYNQVLTENSADFSQFRITNQTVRYCVSDRT
jgi:apolipoprotein D and lipocalin family protein